jgi:hypothetical protein
MRQSAFYTMKSHRFHKHAVTAAALFLVTAASAAPLQHYSDQEIVSRADLIVVGRMREGSLTFVLHPRQANSQSNPESPEYRAPEWEHHLELVVSEVLKGQISSTSVVVRLDYRLIPLVSGCFSNQFMTIEIGGTNYPKGVVEVFDNTISPVQSRPFTGDIRTNHIWLLRRKPMSSSVNRLNILLGVYDPEDIQPIRRRGDIATYLTQSSYSQP